MIFETRFLTELPNWKYEDIQAIGIALQEASIGCLIKFIFLGSKEEVEKNLREFGGLDTALFIRSD